VNCVICGIRKPKRFCPGVHGDICAICCGTEREQTVDCPLGCEYLHSAHEHERLPEVDPAQIPNHEFEITEAFLEENQVPLFLVADAVFEAAMQSQSATDYDARTAFEALIGQYKAGASGIVYEARPVNPYAAAIYDSIQSRLAEVGELAAERGASAFKLPDANILGVLIFLQRLEYNDNNGRKYSRAFLDVMRKFHLDQLKHAEDLPEPDAPRIIL
jgi:hypothetical protein